MRSLKQLMDLHGRVALITGGAGHIGRAMGAALAELGADIAVMDQDAQACAEVSHDLAAKHTIRSTPLAVDLRDEIAVKAAPAQVVKSLGRLDILINCAGLAPAQGVTGWAVPLAEQSSETWRMALEVNLTAAFLLAQAAAETLAASGHGSIINVGSIYGLVGPDMRLYENTPMGNPAAYAASKGGLLQLTRWLATVMAPKVRVNSITPGGVWRNQPESFHEKYKARTPLGRMGAEEDFKGAAAYLASDLSAYVTGQNLIVDGGWTAW